MNTYDPILSVTNLSDQSWLSSPPMPEPGIALVCAGDGRPLLTIQQGQRSLTWGEARWSYQKIYQVDMREHPLQFWCSLPCQGDAFQFYAEVTFRCTVREPDAIVERNVRDVAQWIKSSVEDKMRIISRRYTPKDSGAAEAELRSAINQAIFESGFDLNSFTLKLSLPKEAEAWVQTQTRIQEEMELDRKKQDFMRQTRAFEVEQEEQRLEQERRREEERLKQEQKLEEQRLQQDQKLEEQRLQQQRKYIQERVELENELRLKELKARLAQQEIEQQLKQKDEEFNRTLKQKDEEFNLKMLEHKTSIYSNILQAGNLQVLALQLAQNPGDVQAILQALNQQEQIKRDHNIKVLQTLLDADVIEGWQLTEVGKHALQDLLGFAGQTPVGAISAESNSEAIPQVLESATLAPDLDAPESSTSIAPEPTWDADEDDL
jgi:hypothetical protein